MSFQIWNNGMSYVSDAASTYSPNKEHLLPATYTACTKQTTNSTTKLRLSFTAQNVQETLAITRTKQTTNTYKHSSNSRPKAGCCCVLSFSFSLLSFFHPLLCHFVHLHISFFKHTFIYFFYHLIAALMLFIRHSVFINDIINPFLFYQFFYFFFVF